MHTPFMDKSPHRHRRDGASAGGRLKQRLAQILLRSSCTTNSTTTASSGTAFLSLAKANADSCHSQSQSHQQEAPHSPYFCTPFTYERPTKVDRCSRPRRHHSRSASLVHISVDCTGRASSGRRSVRSDAPLLKHHPSSSSLPARDAKKRRSRKGRSKPPARSPSASRRHCSSPSSSSWGLARRPRSTPAPYSWSSTATDDELAPFSSSADEEGGEEAETRTLFSSLSFSSDSTSELYYHGNTRKSRGSGNTTASSRRAPRRALPRTGETPAPPPGTFRPLVSVEEEKQHRECSERNMEEKGVGAKKLGTAEEAVAGPGMAVVKRSSNPYLDFRSSMVEMVVERRIGSVGLMEELLGSYLSLNSPRHHPAILAAFKDVWEAVFGEE